MGLSHEEIKKIKKDRATAKRLMTERMRVYVAYTSVPAIMIMVGTLVASAYFLKSEALAVVTAMVSTVTMGMINILQQMTAPPDKENDVVTIAKEVAHTTDKMVDNLINQDKSAEIMMDKNHIKIGGNGVSVATSNDKDLVWGDDKPSKKGKK